MASDELTLLTLNETTEIPSEETSILSSIETPHFRYTSSSITHPTRKQLLLRTALILFGSMAPLVFEMCQIRVHLREYLDRQYWFLLRAKRNPILKHDIAVRFSSDFVELAIALGHANACSSDSNLRQAIEINLASNWIPDTASWQKLFNIPSNLSNLLRQRQIIIKNNIRKPFKKNILSNLYMDSYSLNKNTSQFKMNAYIALTYSFSKSPYIILSPFLNKSKNKPSTLLSNIACGTPKFEYHSTTEFPPSDSGIAWPPTLNKIGICLLQLDNIFCNNPIFINALKSPNTICTHYSKTTNYDTYEKNYKQGYLPLEQQSYRYKKNELLQCELSTSMYYHQNYQKFNNQYIFPRGTSHESVTFKASLLEDDMTPSFTMWLIVVTIVFARWILAEIRTVLEMFLPPPIAVDMFHMCSIWSLTSFSITFLKSRAFIKFYYCKLFNLPTYTDTNTILPIDITQHPDIAALWRSFNFCINYLWSIPPVISLFALNLDDLVTNWQHDGLNFNYLFYAQSHACISYILIHCIATIINYLHQIYCSASIQTYQKCTKYLILILKIVRIVCIIYTSFITLHIIFYGFWMTPVRSVVIHITCLISETCIRAFLGLEDPNILSAVDTSTDEIEDVVEVFYPQKKSFMWNIIIYRVPTDLEDVDDLQITDGCEFNMRDTETNSLLADWTKYCKCFKEESDMMQSRLLISNMCRQRVKYLAYELHEIIKLHDLKLTKQLKSQSTRLLVEKTGLQYYKLICLLPPTTTRKCLLQLMQCLSNYNHSNTNQKMFRLLEKSSNQNSNQHSFERHEPIRQFERQCDKQFERETNQQTNQQTKLQTCIYSQKCYICMNSAATAIMYPCMHGGCCEPCGCKIVTQALTHQKDPKCPICRRLLRAVGTVEADFKGPDWLFTEKNTKYHTNFINHLVNDTSNINLLESEIKKLSSSQYLIKHMKVVRLLVGICKER